MTKASDDRLFLEVDGGRIHYVDEGSGPVVLMVHGSPVSSFSFREQIKVLRTHRRVVALDLIGFGHSSKPPGGANFTLQAHALRAFIDALGLERFALVVHDWGGPIGLGCVAAWPEQVDALVLINTTILEDFAPPLYWRAMISRGLGDFLHERLNLFGRGLPLLLRAARRAEIRAVYREPFEHIGTRRTVLALERLEGYAALARRFAVALPRMQVPTLIAWGDPDPYFRKPELERLSALFDSAQVRKLPGAGHFPQEDAPHELAQVLDDFLRTH